MKKCMSLVLGLVFFLSVVAPCLASPADDAVALVKEAAAYVKANGREKGLAEINNPKGKFFKGELYVFAYDMKGTIIGHPANPKLVGKDMTEIKDSDGKYFTKEFLSVVNGPGKGWVEYKWTNPTTKKIEAKASYLEKAGDIFVGCGIYK